MKHLTLLLIAITTLLTACDTVDDSRLPATEVHISFYTIGDWEKYGVTGAMDYKRFIKSERVPSDFPFTALTYTGYGGILLVSDVLGNYLAYDLACPYEARYDVRLTVNKQTNYAECPKCGSAYDVFLNQGTPVSGPALDKGFGLTRYKVGPGSGGDYMLVYR